MAQTVVEALALKHEVTVLCGRPSYDPTERRPWRLYQSESSGTVRVLRVGSSDYPRTQMHELTALRPLHLTELAAGPVQATRGAWMSKSFRSCSQAWVRA